MAAAAYRSGQPLFDERLAKSHDFSRKEDIVYTSIFLPEGAPIWMADRETLWNAVEHTEKRKDAQLAREVQLTLPRELTLEQNIALTRAFVKETFVANGMVADVSIHNPKGKDGEYQPHVHVLLTLRECTPDGFGFKNRSWNERALLEHWREAWESHLNHQLALHGIDQTVDHRSYKKQGIALEPQSKIGPVSANEYSHRVAEHQRIAAENGQQLLQNPSLVFDLITRQQSTFTDKDLARFVSRHTVDAAQFNQVYYAAKASPNCVAIGVDKKGEQRFTTPNMLFLEAGLLNAASDLARRKNNIVHADYLEAALAQRTLSDEQQQALHHLTHEGDLKLLVGYAGTGKSYLLGAAREAWEQAGYRVHGTALSGIAAHNLTHGSGIASRTLASLIYRLDQDRLAFTKKDVLVVDEAGMLGSQQLARLVEATNKAGAKLVLVGDWQQLQAIEAGAAFRTLAERHGYAELKTVRRQRESWQVKASIDLAQGQVKQALEAYEQHAHVHRFNTAADAQQALIAQWNDVRITAPKTSQLMLAYTREAVKALNEEAREAMRQDQALGEETVFTMARGQRAFAPQDRVCFLKRDDRLSVINGTLGTIQSIDSTKGTILVCLDQDDLKKEDRIVTVDTATYPHLEHGYASTIHKAQGVTVDRTYVLPTFADDAHSTYVAMTRHRESCDLFVSQAAFENEQQLLNTLKRDRSKDMVFDYEDVRVAFGKQRGLCGRKIAGDEQINTRSEPSAQHKQGLEKDTLETQVAAFLKVFERFRDAFREGSLTRGQKVRAAKLIEQVCHHPEFMQALKKQDRALSKQLATFIQRQKRLSRDRDQGFDR